jgi:uncharacterized protein (DUF2225 family)
MYITDVTVKCPDCGIKFNAKQLPVLLDTGYRNSELRQDFKGTLPQFEQYAVYTCPGCGRVDWSNSFPEIEEIAVLNQANMVTHLQFRTAAINAERRGKDFYNVGLFYLYAAWCADDSRAFPQAREYRRLAADAFKKSLVDTSCPIANRDEIQYLIGELLRRSGEFEASKNHFQQILPHLPGRFALMSRKLVRLAESRDQNAIDFNPEDRGY